MITPPPWWLPQAIGSVDRLIASAEPPLAHRLETAVSRIARMNGGSSLETSFCSVATTPFLALINAFRTDVGLSRDDPRVAAVGEGAVLLYVYARIQDDLVDEPALLDRGYVYAAEVFGGASARAFAGAVPESAAFFAFRERIMSAFADVAAWEMDVYRAGGGDGDDLDIARLGKKFLPMAVPLGALAFAAERTASLESVVQCVVLLGSGLQVINDVFNVHEDHTSGRLTPVLRWLYAGKRVAPDDRKAPVRAALLADSSLERALERARGDMERARAVAVQAGADCVAEVIRERIEFVATVPTRLFALCLRGRVT